MVAGRSPWGSHQQQTAEDQPDRGGQLGVEAILEHGRRARELGCLRAGVEPGRQVHQEDDREAERSEAGDDATQPSPARAQRAHGERRGQQRHWDEEVGVRLAGRLDSHSGGRGRQAGIARLPHLDTAVVGELGGDQAGGGGDDDGADRTVWREDGAGADRRPPRQSGCAAHSALDRAEDAKEEDGYRPQPPAQPARPAPPLCRSASSAGQSDASPSRRSHPQLASAPRRASPGRSQATFDLRGDALQPTVDRAVNGARPLLGRVQRGPCASPNRCYHRPSLRLLLC
jgi:hypothetical protein